MKSQTTIQFFPILSGGEFYPVTFSKILLVFYTSNQQYLTREEIQFKTNLLPNEVTNGLQFLIRHGEISTKKENVLSKEYYSFNTEGRVKNLKNSISKSKDLLISLEKVVDQRDDSNQVLNDFIKDTIVFYSEVLDYIEVKISKHFNSKTLK